MQVITRYLFVFCGACPAVQASTLAAQCEAAASRDWTASIPSDPQPGSSAPAPSSPDQDDEPAVQAALLASMAQHAPQAAAAVSQLGAQSGPARPAKPSAALQAGSSARPQPAGLTAARHLRPGAASDGPRRSLAIVDLMSAPAASSAPAPSTAQQERRSDSPSLKRKAAAGVDLTGKQGCVIDLTEDEDVVGDEAAPLAAADADGGGAEQAAASGSQADPEADAMDGNSAGGDDDEDDEAWDDDDMYDDGSDGDYDMGIAGVLGSAATVLAAAVHTCLKHLSMSEAAGEAGWSIAAQRICLTTDSELPGMCSKEPYAGCLASHACM